MAADNIKDFSVDWILFGVLFLALMSFTISFTFNNNANALGDYSSPYNNTLNNYTTNLQSVESTSNTVKNITSQNNPEVSDQGSSDSVASAFKTSTSPSDIFKTTKLMISLMFGGDIGKILITVFAGLFGLILAFWIYKAIRVGA